MRAFVTGGSGFVGRQLIRDLVAQGCTVRALARSDAAAGNVRGLGAEAVSGDLDDEDALNVAVQGCDVVFHAAAKVEVWGKREDFERVTIHGTRRVLRAAREARVTRFVHVSTEAVLVGGAPLIDADETWPLPTQPLGLYPWSKGQAEAEVHAAVREGLHAVIVRPRAIWGAGDNVFLPRLCKLVDEGKFSWIDQGRALTSTCHVKNVTSGMMLAAARGGAGQTYFLTDGPAVTYREYFGGLLGAVGRDANDSRSIPLGVARTLAHVMEATWQLFGQTSEPMLTKTAVALIGEQVTVNDAKARRELGYTPVISRQAGLDELRVTMAR